MANLNTIFQFERGELLNNIVLFEDHAELYPCPFCMEKHASKIVGYADEIASGREGDENDLWNIAEKFRSLKEKVASFKQGAHTWGEYLPLGAEAREVRRKLQGILGAGHEHPHLSHSEHIEHIHSEEAEHREHHVSVGFITGKVLFDAGYAPEAQIVHVVVDKDLDVPAKTGIDFATGEVNVHLHPKIDENPKHKAVVLNHEIEESNCLFKCASTCHREAKINEPKGVREQIERLFA